jgi:hypothetical protein
MNLALGSLLSHGSRISFTKTLPQIKRKFSITLLHISQEFGFNVDMMRTQVRISAPVGPAYGTIIIRSIPFSTAPKPAFSD